MGKAERKTERLDFLEDRPNKCTQRRPRSEFLIVPSVLRAAPLMRSVSQLFAKRQFLLDKRIIKLFCYLTDVTTESLTHKEECSDVHIFLRWLRMRSDPV